MEKSNGMGHTEQPRAPGPRHSILDLAPLELECLSVLWPLGEGTVRDIHHGLTASRRRAYTTVMTIMDRLEQKGIVARRKVGRAFLYQPKLSAEEARGKAVEKIVEGFFNGSPEALVAHLSDRGNVSSPEPALAPASVDVPSTPGAELPSRNLDESLL
jgi:BlaI family penicillinase repressor